MALRFIRVLFDPLCILLQNRLPTMGRKSRAIGAWVVFYRLTKASSTV